VLGALAVERELHQRGEPRAQAAGVEQRDAALDHAGVHQAPHPAQRRGRRGVGGGGQCLVGERGIGLKQLEQPQVGGVEVDGGRRLQELGCFG